MKPVFPTQNDRDDRCALRFFVSCCASECTIRSLYSIDVGIIKTA